MPKKTRKMKERAAQRRGNQTFGLQDAQDEPVLPAQQEAAPTRMRPAMSSLRSLTPLTFDYSHIYGDLRRIAIFAAFFFGVLVVLSFVIK